MNAGWNRTTEKLSLESVAVELAHILFLTPYEITDDLIWGEQPGLKGNVVVTRETQTTLQLASGIEELYAKLVQMIYEAGGLEYVEDVPATWQGEVIGFTFDLDESESFI